MIHFGFNDYLAHMAEHTTYSIAYFGCRYFVFSGSIPRGADSAVSGS